MILLDTVPFINWQFGLVVMLIVSQFGAPYWPGVQILVMVVTIIGQILSRESISIDGSRENNRTHSESISKAK